MFHDFTLTIFISQVFQSPWEPCYYPLFSETDFGQKEEKGLLCATTFYQAVISTMGSTACSLPIGCVTGEKVLGP